MTELKRKYLLASLAMLIASLILSLLILYFWIGGLRIYELLPITFFYWAVYELGFLWLCRMVERNPKRMPLSFSVVKGVRFFLFVGFAVYYSIMHSEDLKVFLVLFAILYAVWLAFETTFFYKNNKAFLEGTKGEEKKRI